MTWLLKQRWRSWAGVHSLRPDPYLVWAHATNWADFLGDGSRRSRRMHDLPFLIELNRPLIGLFRLFAGRHVYIPPQYRTGRFFTAWVPYPLLGLLHRWPLAAMIRRMDLCQPRRAQRQRRWMRWNTCFPRWKQKSRLTVDTPNLVGIIDDGCPFAHPGLVTFESGQPRSRFAGLWDVAHPSRAVFGKVAGYGGAPAGFGFGHEIRRTYPVGDPRQGLNNWLSRYCLGEVSGIEEETSYEDANHTAMRRSATHGAYVTDLLAGPVRWRDRHASDPDAPPSWASSDAETVRDTKRTDFVFVQMPRSGLHDVSGGWLGTHVLDAVSYVLGTAGSATTKVVINLSYGCTVGPHDGSAMLECALDELIADWESVRRSVDLVVAAGNSFDAGGHARFDVEAAGTTALTWRVLPESEMPSFLEIWLPENASPAGVTVEVVPPGNGTGKCVGVDSVAVWSAGVSEQATVVFLSSPSRGENAAMCLVALAPTRIDQGEREQAPHGDWRIVVHSPHALTGVHAYIARNDRELGTARRGRQSFFVDEHDEPSRHLRRCHDDPGMQPGDLDSADERTGSVVYRRGSLSGIATAPRLNVAAGYRLSDGRHARYSSAGKRGDCRGRRPTVSLPTDETAVLRGIRAAGSRNGITARLVGTSSAAPQQARRLVNGENLRTPNPPARLGDEPQDPEDLYGDEGRVEPNPV